MTSTRDSFHNDHEDDTAHEDIDSVDHNSQVEHIALTRYVKLE